MNKRTKPEIKPRTFMLLQGMINNMQGEINKANNNIFRSFERRLHRIEDMIEHICDEVYGSDLETPTSLGLDTSGFVNPPKRFRP